MTYATNNVFSTTRMQTKLFYSAASSKHQFSIGQFLLHSSLLINIREELHRYALFCMMGLISNMCNTDKGPLLGLTQATPQILAVPPSLQIDKFGGLSLLFTELSNFQ